MREILFRGKIVDNCEWIEGDLIHATDGLFVRQQNKPNLNLPIISKINSNTVCQFTGLTDKNGTKIFECDVVTIKSGEEYMFIREIDKYCVVKFSYGSFNPVDIDEVHYDFGNIDEFEVIGNIFDSPELLK